MVGAIIGCDLHRIFLCDFKAVITDLQWDGSGARRGSVRVVGGISMRTLITFLVSVLLLSGCSSEHASNTASGKVLVPTPAPKTLSVGLNQADTLARLHSANASEVPKAVWPDGKAWAVPGTHDCLFLGFRDGRLQSISVEQQSDAPKVHRRWYSTNTYTLP